MTPSEDRSEPLAVVNAALGGNRVLSDGVGPSALARLDRDVLAERAMVVERHLARVAARLPDTVDAFQAATDPSDAVSREILAWLPAACRAFFGDAF